MAVIWKGAPAAAALNEITKKKCEALLQKQIVPCLAILRVGARDDDVAYENSAVKRCSNLGIAVKKLCLPDAVSQQELLDTIRELNCDDAVHGVLMFRPLPRHLDESEVCRTLSPEKDVDGITPGSLAGVFSDTETGFPPCTARACIEILDHYGVELSGKRAVVVGRSLVIGKPVAMMLLKKNATVTICHTKTLSKAELCRRADILVVAAGKEKAVGAEDLSPQQIVVDVGIHVSPDGSVCGDVDRGAAEETVYALTPVPGGVGSVTTAVLASHVVAAAERKTRVAGGEQT